MAKAVFSTMDGSENIFLGWREKGIGLDISSIERIRAVEEFFSTTLKGVKALNVRRAGYASNSS